MSDLPHQASFILAILIFQLTPGPGTLTVLRATADHGREAGFAAVAGTLLGGLLCMGAAVGGLAAVMNGVPHLIQLVQWAGSAYLAWMGWSLLHRRRQAAAPATAAAVPALGLHLRQALAVSLTNPKVILFYFALFPLFLQDTVAGPTLAVMVLQVTGISLAYQCALVVVGHRVARGLGHRPSAGQIAQRVAGVALIGFALRLVLG